MYKTNLEAIELVNSLKRELIDIEEVEIVVCPSFIALSEISELLESSNIKLGAQNMYWKEEGAFTGEVSANMLKSIGCQYVILGHSERRQYFAETDAGVNSKFKAALKSDLIPIVCIGETLEQREANQTLGVIEAQLSGALKDTPEFNPERIVFAYEPVWAIGTGKNATSEQAQEVHKFIRTLLNKWYNDDVSSAVRILYGGSVKPENIKELIAQEDIDGALVGGASLKTESFTRIVKQCLDY